MGAECWINNLHFHILNTDEIFKAEEYKFKTFPIEQSPIELLFQSTLQHRNEDEINMFSTGVRFSVTSEWPVPAFVIEPWQSEEQKTQATSSLETSDPTESVAHAVGVILNLLID